MMRAELPNVEASALQAQQRASQLEDAMEAEGGARRRKDRLLKVHGLFFLKQSTPPPPRGHVYRQPSH